MQTRHVQIDDLERAWLERAPRLPPPSTSTAPAFFPMPARPLPEPVIQLVARIPGMNGDVLEWFRTALGDRERKWFAVRLLQARPELALPLKPDLLRAALAEENPSANQEFLKPLFALACSWAELRGALLQLTASHPELQIRVPGVLYWLSLELGPASLTPLPDREHCP